MNDLQIFENAEFGELRTIQTEDRTLFCGSDVAKALGYKRPNDAISAHCRATVKYSTPISGKIQEINFISEGDVYRLITHSKLPAAEKFESWVFDEVLPTVHKHGAYMTPEKLEEVILNPDTMIKLCTALKEEQDKNKALQAVNSQLTVDNTIMKPKADYFDELVDRNLLTNFTDTAKLLKVKRKAFIQFLLDRKYIFRDKKGNLKPYAGKKDLFEIKESFNEKTKWKGEQTLITPKGRETFRLLMINK